MISHMQVAEYVSRELLKSFHKAFKAVTVTGSDVDSSVLAEEATIVAGSSAAVLTAVIDLGADAAMPAAIK